MGVLATLTKQALDSAKQQQQFDSRAGERLQASITANDRNRRLDRANVEASRANIELSKSREERLDREQQLKVDAGYYDRLGQVRGSANRPATLTPGQYIGIQNDISSIEERKRQAFDLDNRRRKLSKQLGTPYISSFNPADFDSEINKLSQIAEAMSPLNAGLSPSSPPVSSGAPLPNFNEPIVAGISEPTLLSPLPNPQSEQPQEINSGGRIPVALPVNSGGDQTPIDASLLPPIEGGQAPLESHPARSVKAREEVPVGQGAIAKPISNKQVYTAAQNIQIVSSEDDAVAASRVSLQLQGTMDRAKATIAQVGSLYPKDSSEYISIVSTQEAIVSQSSQQQDRLNKQTATYYSDLQKKALNPEEEEDSTSPRASDVDANKIAFVESFLMARGEFVGKDFIGGKEMSKAGGGVSPTLFKGTSLDISAVMTTLKAREVISSLNKIIGENKDKFDPERLRFINRLMGGAKKRIKDQPVKEPEPTMPTSNYQNIESGVFTPDSSKKLGSSSKRVLGNLFK